VRPFAETIHRGRNNMEKVDTISFKTSGRLTVMAMAMASWVEEKGKGWSKREVIPKDV
jgi:hypothetical protein